MIHRIKTIYLHRILVELFWQLSKLLLRFMLVSKLLKPIQLFDFSNRIRLLFQQLQDLEPAEARNQQRIMWLGPVAADHLDCQGSSADPKTRTDSRITRHLPRNTLCAPYQEAIDLQVARAFWVTVPYHERKPNYTISFGTWFTKPNPDTWKRIH